MIQQRILYTGLWIAVISMMSVGDADARWRCRNRWNGYNSGYAYSYGSGYSYGTQGGAYAAPMNGNQVIQGGVINQGATINGAPLPQNNSVNRPTYAEPTVPANQLPATAPQPVIEGAPINNINNGQGNTLPSNPNPQQVQTNSSPDPDNEGRNASKIPGTAPTKAPAPAAGANP